MGKKTYIPIFKLNEIFVKKIVVIRLFSPKFRDL